MNAREVAEKNKILEFMVGSKLYGTDTETSDTDYSGVFMPHEDMVYGFERAEEVDLSVKSKRKDGKNDENAVDKILYELRKFVRLAMDNNPNVLEQMFVNKENLVYSNYWGEELLRNAELFPHRGLAVKYKAYAFSQKHKMVIRTDSYHALVNANEWLDEYLYDDNVDKGVQKSKTLLVEILDKRLPFMSVKGDNVLVGDLNFQKHFMLRKVKKMIAERLSKATNRKDLLTKHGYDVKFASHLIRLLMEAKELLSTGRLEFPLRYRQTILDVKLGKWKMSEVLSYAEELDNKLDDVVEFTALPKRPRYDEVQNLVKRLIKSWFSGNNLI
jgi:predicted nucleotidyltransferase